MDVDNDGADNEDDVIQTFLASCPLLPNWAAQVDALVAAWSAWSAQVDRDLCPVLECIRQLATLKKSEFRRAELLEACAQALRVIRQAEQASLSVWCAEDDTRILYDTAEMVRLLQEVARVAEAPPPTTTPEEEKELADDKLAALAALGRAAKDGAKRMAAPCHQVHANRVRFSSLAQTVQAEWASTLSRSAAAMREWIAEAAKLVKRKTEKEREQGQGHGVALSEAQALLEEGSDLVVAFPLLAAVAAKVDEALAVQTDLDEFLNQPESSAEEAEKMFERLADVNVVVQGQQALDAVCERYQVRLGLGLGLG